MCDTSKNNIRIQSRLQRTGRRKVVPSTLEVKEEPPSETSSQQNHVFLKPELRSIKVIKFRKQTTKLVERQACKRRKLVRSNALPKRRWFPPKHKLVYDPKVPLQTLLCRDVMSSIRSSEKQRRVTKCTNIRLTTDPLVLYCIALHKHLHNLQDMIDIAQTVVIESKGRQSPKPLPPMPEKVKLPKRKPGLNITPLQITPFSLGVSRCNKPEISSAAVRLLVGQGVAALTGLLGVETINQSVFDVLVDVSLEFYGTLARHLKLAADDQDRGWSHDFPNIAERVFVELGIGSCRVLLDHYQTRVVKYTGVLEKRCGTLARHYKDLMSRKSIAIDNDPKICEIPIKVETEEEVIEIDVPQVQLALNEEYELPSLDAGYQLLNSLEANT